MNSNANPNIADNFGKSAWYFIKADPNLKNIITNRLTPQKRLKKVVPKQQLRISPPDQQLGPCQLCLESYGGNIENVKKLIGESKRNDAIDFVSFVNSRDKEGWTPLLFASQEGHLQIVSLLLENGAKINGVTYNDVSPLMIAVFHNRHQSVKLLLQYGADSRLINQAGTTAMDLASSKQKMLELFKKYDRSANLP